MSKSAPTVIHKQQAASPVSPAGEVSIPALVDQLGLVKQKLKKLEALQAEEKSLRAQLINRLNLKPEKGTVALGVNFSADVSEQQFERSYDKAKLIQAIGESCYIENSSITLGVLDNLLNDGQKAEVISRERTGSRKVTVRALPKARAA